MTLVSSENNVVVASEPTLETRNSVAISNGRLMPSSIDELFRLSDALFKSELFQGHRNTMSVMVAILKGMDVGFTPTQALEEVYVVKGKASFSAKAILALIRRSNLVDPTVGVQIKVMGEGADMIASITSKRRDEPAAVTDTFSMKDAKLAGQTNDVWRKFPKRMLRWKVIALHADMQYPDVTVGNAAKELIEDFPANRSINEIVKDAAPPVPVAQEDTALQALGIGWDAPDGGGSLEFHDAPGMTGDRDARKDPTPKARKAPPLVLSIDDYEPDPNVVDGK